MIHWEICLGGAPYAHFYTAPELNDADEVLRRWKNRQQQDTPTARVPENVTARVAPKSWLQAV